MLLGNQKIKLFALASSLFLASCASPQAQEKEREKSAEEVVRSAVQQMLDRNPSTIQDSMNYLSNSEMARDIFEKLQSEHMLPETDISILRIKQEATEKHTSNEVIVSSVRPLTDGTKPTVRFQVTGKQIMKKDGKPVGEQPFQYTVTCKIPDPTVGNPQIIDLVSDLKPEHKHAEDKPAEHKGRRR